jgi:WD40 repeat protein
VGDIQGNVSITSRGETNLPPAHKLHQERITAIGIGTESEVVTAGRELSVRWTDMATNTNVAPPLESAGQIEQVIVNHNGEEIMLVAADTSVRLWRKDSGTPLTVRKPQHARYIGMSVAGRGLVVTRDEGRAMEVLSLSSSSAAPMLLHSGRSITLGNERPRTLAFTQGDASVLSTDGQGYASRWDVTQARLGSVDRWPKTALAVAPVKGGKFVAALGDGTLVEASASSDQLETLLEPDVSEALSPVADFSRWQIAAVSPDGRAAAWSELPVNPLALCSVRVFDRASGSVRTFQYPRVVTLAISAARHLLVLGLNNGVVRIADLQTGATEDYSWHLSRLTALAISADGNLLVTGSTDGNVALWDTRSRQPRSSYVRLGTPVLGVALSGDGRRFAASTDHDVIVGEVATQSILGPRLPFPHTGGEVALNTDGTRLAVAGIDGATTIFQIAPDIPSPPPWFEKFTLTFASRSFTTDGVMDTTSHPGLLALKQALPANSSGPWGDFAQWMLTHPGARAMTPWSDLKLDAYLTEVNRRPGDVADIERNRHAPAVRSQSGD